MDTLPTSVRERITYEIKDMRDWEDLEADLVITDPPFGLEFDGKASNYNRDTDRVVDGYVEWDIDEYASMIDDLLDVAARATTTTGQAIIFSGMDNSHRIHQTILDHPDWTFQGKLYWAYNFAPYCKNRPAHNIYELFWMTKGDEWYYSNECRYDHCRNNEANLSLLKIKREYLKEMPKYPTRLPLTVVNVLLDHFSQEDDLVFDPLAGAGSVGLAAAMQGRNAVMGDLNPEAREIFAETVDELTPDDATKTLDQW